MVINYDDIIERLDKALSALESLKELLEVAAVNDQLERTRRVVKLVESTDDEQ